MGKYKVGDKFVIKVTYDCDDGYYETTSGDDFTEEELARLEPYNPQDTAEESWDFMRYIFDEMDTDDLRNCFGTISIHVLLNQPYSEVKEKYEKWKSRDELKAGDEVIAFAKIHGIVVNVNNNHNVCHVLLKEGSSALIESKHLKKTGRHTDAAETLMKFIEDRADNE